MATGGTASVPMSTGFGGAPPLVGSLTPAGTVSRTGWGSVGGEVS